MSVYNDETDGAVNVRFGHGTVRISRGYLDGDTPDHESVIVLSETPHPYPVGVPLATDDPHALIGTSTKDIPGAKVKLIFDSLEGLNALYDELVLLRHSMKEPKP